jgi:NADH-quinone oxidoreductase subunit K
MNLSLMILISMAMLTIGIIGLLVKRNILIMFLCIELMLNAGNLLFVTFAYQWENQIGLAWVFFVLVVAAVGLALIIHLFRSKQVVDVDQYNALRG